MSPGTTLPEDLAALIVRASSRGVETSLRDLAELLGVLHEGRLSAACKVVDYVEAVGLFMAPPVEVGEFDSPRVLRATEGPDAALRVREVLAEGEGPNLEFKASMLCSVRDWDHHAQLVEQPALAGEVLKTLCAFLNSEGGELVVGARDDGTVGDGLGLDFKLKNWSPDKWQLHFWSLVETRFYEGRQISPFLTARMIAINERRVFFISVMPRTVRSFVQKDKGKPYEFFVRSGPRTKSLDLPGFYQHLCAGQG